MDAQTEDLSKPLLRIYKVCVLVLWLNQYVNPVRVIRMDLLTEENRKAKSQGHTPEQETDSEGEAAALMGRNILFGSEVEDLKEENAALKKENAKLKKENESMKEKLEAIQHILDGDDKIVLQDSPSAFSQGGQSSQESRDEGSESGII